MGKLILAFILFVTASAFAIGEARVSASAAVPAPSGVAMEPEPYARPAPATHEAPPWVRWAPPPAPTLPVAPPPPPRLTVDASDRARVNDSDDDIPDGVDRCPDEPSAGDDDDDGCPDRGAAIDNGPQRPAYTVIVEAVEYER